MTGNQPDGVRDPLSGTDRAPGPGRQAPTQADQVERLYEAIDRRLPYIMVAPAVLLVVGLMVYPLVWAVKLSLYEVKIYNLDAQSFVGGSNYAQILANPTFYDVMWNTAVFVGASVVGQLGIGLALAVLLDQDWVGAGLARLFRASYILPWATTGVIVAYSWQFLFNPRLGLVNQFLRSLGWANPPAWVSSVEWAIVAVIVANVWRGTPFSLVFQTSGLQHIRRRWYEAATVGGAGRLQTLRHVTLPLVRPFVLMNLVLITLFTVNVFDLIFVMTGGGPLDRTTVLSLYMYETAFEVGDFGRASALAVILFAINLAMIATYLALFGVGTRAQS